MYRMIGLLLILGALFVQLTNSMEVHSIASSHYWESEKLLESLITRVTDQNHTTDILSVLGSLFTAIGLVLFTKQIRETSNLFSVRLLSYVATFLTIAGMVLFILYQYRWATTITRDELLFYSGTDWDLHTYIILTIAALSLVGYLLWKTPYSKWFAALVLIFAAYFPIHYALSK